MQFIAVREPGEPDVMTLEEGPLPEPTEDEVLIKVAAAGVNRPDLLQREGIYPAPAGSSQILGLEVSGTLVQVGSKVRGWHLGQRVCALTNGGGYAQYVAVPASQCFPVPEAFDLISAAGLPEALFTVWANVFESGRLMAGESLLVHGGAGGIGHLAIQMARTTGARVYATASTQQKCNFCETLGALRAIPYRTEDFVAVIRQVTGRGADVILDMVGGDYIQRNIKAASAGGRIVNIAFMQGSRVTVNLMPLMLKRIILTGSTLRSRPQSDKARMAMQLQQKIWPAVLAGRIRPVIHKKFSLNEAALAHRTLNNGEVMGKLLLIP